MQMCAHLYDTATPILNSYLIHCNAGYTSVAYVDTVWSTQCELPGMTGCLCTSRPQQLVWAAIDCKGAKIEMDPLPI